jgi:hypothetical protein
LVDELPVMRRTIHSPSGHRSTVSCTPLSSLTGATTGSTDIVSRVFDRWGAVVVRHRWKTLITAVLLALIGGGYGISVFDSMAQGGYEDPGSEAVRALRVMQSDPLLTTADVVAVYTAPDGERADSPRVAATVGAALQRLPTDAVASVTTYWQTEAPFLLSDDGRSALVLVTLAGDDTGDKQQSLAVVEPILNIDGVETMLTGSAPVEAAISEQTKRDLFLAEGIALPVVMVLLVIIFGGVLAASLPVLIGALTVPTALGVLRLIADATTVNEFAVNVAGLLGLGMAIDYGLFIVSRFREERDAGVPVEKAVRTTVGTAGRTVAFSSDTGYCAPVAEAARRADVFVCEATYLEADEQALHGHGHLTARLAGELAAQAEARHLVLTHFASPADWDQGREHAEEAFDGQVSIAVPGTTFVP